MGEPQDKNPMYADSAGGTTSSSEGAGGAVTTPGDGGADSSSDGGAQALGTGGDQTEPRGDGGSDDGAGGAEQAGGTGGATVADPCSQSCEELPTDTLFVHSALSGIPLGASENNNASITIDTSFPRNQESSVFKLTTDDNESEAEIGVNFPLLSEGDLLFRAWMRVPEGPMNEWVKVVGFNPEFGSVPEGQLNTGVHVRIDPMGRILVLHAEGGTPSSSDVDAYPRDVWFCLQVLVTIDDEKGVIDVRVDGASVLRIQDVDTSPGVGVERIVYGIAEIGPGEESHEIYFDEVYAAVPCEEASVP